MKWIWIILAILYVLSPYDLIPGMHGVGWIDDIIVIIMLYRYLWKLNRIRTMRGAPSGNQRNEGPSSNGDRSKAESHVPQTPYEILGIEPTTSQDDIKAAYRKLVNQYHPDKVAHLGEEL